MKRILVLSIALLPVAAVADCLDNSSLDEGVLVTFSDGSEAQIERIEGNLLRTSSPPRGFDQFVMVGHYGIYMTQSERSDDGLRRVRSDQDFLVTPPVPSADMKFETVVARLSTAPTASQQVQVTTSTATELLVGGCRYQTFNIEIIYWMDSEPRFGERVASIYFPELGFGVPSWGKSIRSIEVME